jgi:hypothetical protein
MWNTPTRRSTFSSITSFSGASGTRVVGIFSFFDASFFTTVEIFSSGPGKAGRAIDGLLEN